MTDAAAVLLALATAGGAWLAWPAPPWLGGVVVLVGLAGRRAAVLVVGAALLASGLGARAWTGLRPPVVGEWVGWVTLVSDPVRREPGVRVDVRVQGKRVEAWAYGSAAGRLADRLAGERVHVRGRLRALPADARARLARRHVGARLSVEEVGGWRPGGPVARLGNAFRRTLARGAASLPDDRRALFAGFVLGDDREQSREIAFDFRAAGLAHLLAVSGQNVAFVLALVGPLLSRLGGRTRFAAGLVVLGLFGTVTRWEPSVLRAVAMTGVAMTGTLVGRPASGVRRLSLAVAGLLLVDPLLVTSVGFLLSVGASAGIVLLAPTIARVLPGPASLARAAAVTLAAQVGVAPVLLPVFGGMPVVSLLANLLAAPAAAPVTAWGIVAGLPAGLVGGSLATVLHLPTQALVAWVAVVARMAAALPLGDLGAVHVAGAVVAVLVAMAARRRRVVRCLAVVACVVTVASPAVSLARSGSGVLAGEEIAAGATLWRAGGAAVLVVDRPDPARVLDALRRAGVRRIDVLVATRPGVAAGARVRAVLRRVSARVVLAPPGHALAGAVVPPAGARARAGRLAIAVDRVSPRLEVAVSVLGHLGTAMDRAEVPRTGGAVGSGACGCASASAATTSRRGRW